MIPHTNGRSRNTCLIICGCGMTDDAFMSTAVTAAASVPFLSSRIKVLCSTSSIATLSFVMPEKFALLEKAFLMPIFFSTFLSEV